MSLLREAVVVPIGDPSGAADARRQAALIARRLGFGEAAAGNLAIAVTELATNLIKHAGRGELIAQPMAEGTRQGLDIVCVDRGPGMDSVAAAMRDGYSTAGSPGHGLGAIGRLADRLDIHSSPAGTVIAARFWSRPRHGTDHAGRLDATGFAVAMAGESACGDAWAQIDRSNGGRLLVADGLGHGPLAAEASRRAVELVGDHPGSGPAETLDRLHAGLRSTRGAAAALVDIDLDRELVRYAGVGNIAATLVTGGASRSMVSHNGTLGHEARRIAEFTYPFPRDAVLVLHSDGLASRWSLDAYPGLAARHPGVIAGVLYRDFRRERDDVTVVVVRAARPEGSAPRPEAVGGREETRT